QQIYSLEYKVHCTCLMHSQEPFLRKLYSTERERALELSRRTWSLTALLPEAEPKSASTPLTSTPISAPPAPSPLTHFDKASKFKNTSSDKQGEDPATQKPYAPNSELFHP